MTLRMYRFMLFIPFFLIGGCSDEEDKATPDKSNKGPILEDQTRALKKAKDVEQVLQNAADKRRQAIDK